MSIHKIKKLIAVTPFKIGLLMTVFSLFVYALGIPFFDIMEQKAYDVHFISRGPIPAGDETVIVAIDEKSIDVLGRWPWPRTRIAELVERLNHYQARVVAFDVVFSEPDESSGVGVMRKLAENARDREVREAFQKAAHTADNDAALARALKANPSVILGYFFFTSQEEVEHRGIMPERDESRPIPSRFDSLRYLEQGAPPPVLPSAQAVERNIPIIAAASASFGYFNIIPDSDGTVRWAPLAMRYGDTIYSHLSLETVRKYLGSPPLIMNAASYGVDSIQIGKLRLHTDEHARLLINFRGPQKTFPHYSVADVLNGSVPAAALRDKIVLVGATAVGIYDLRVTPYSGTFPGIEIHANIIDNILRGDAISRPAWIAAFDIVAILIIGLGVTSVISRIRPVWATIVTVLLAVGYAAANELMFVHAKVWLTSVYPVFTMVTTFFGVTTYRFMTEQKQKREIKDAFGRYVAPSLVNDILKDPAKLVLGGEERRLTVLFSDIRGFTTISESLTPQALVKLMNDYLTPMTDVVLKSGGTVDKFMGDAIMAFWGAPVWQEDHPVKACRAALQMLEKLAELQPVWEKAGIPKLDIGVGISTGNLTVGNMGSTTRFDYTVMGDSVNLGSRLEGLNKEYGTRIIVPKYTFEDVKNDFILRQLDRIKVKGKKIPVKIYELMGDSSADGKLREIAGLFEAGLTAYLARDWDLAESYFKKTLNIRHGDGPSAVFLSRIRTLRETTLPDDWDGVYVMTKK